MSDNKIDGEWLEPVLRRGLTRVPAPTGLWDRVVLPRSEGHRVQPAGRAVWMLAVASAMTASLFAIVWGYRPVHAGSGSPGHRLEFRSTEAADVRTWIRNRTGVDIPLLADPSGRLTMTGASIAESGAVEVRFRASEQDARLVVAEASVGLPEHRHVLAGLMQHATTVSWTQGSLGYSLTVERAEGLRVACIVCHANWTL